jgi:hypothetical protein
MDVGNGVAGPSERRAVTAIILLLDVRTTYSCQKKAICDAVALDLTEHSILESICTAHFPGVPLCTWSSEPDGEIKGVLVENVHHFCSKHYLRLGRCVKIGLSGSISAAPVPDSLRADFCVFMSINRGA